MAKSRTILIWHNNGEQQFTFTVNPERLRVSRPARAAAETVEEIRQPVLMQAASYQQSGNHGA